MKEMPANNSLRKMFFGRYKNHGYIDRDGRTSLDSSGTYAHDYSIAPYVCIFLFLSGRAYIYYILKVQYRDRK
jgi:hypothetical protein